MLVTTEFINDFQRPRKNTWQVVQEDSTRKIRLTLKDGGNDYNIAADLASGDSWIGAVSYRKADGLGGIYDTLPAAEYDADATYSAGDYATHDGAVYHALVDIGTPESWTAAHWELGGIAAVTLVSGTTNQFDVILIGQCFTAPGWARINIVFYNVDMSEALHTFAIEVNVQENAGSNCVSESLSQVNSLADVQRAFANIQVALSEINDEISNMIDSTLSVQGKAADAKATGDALSELSDEIDLLNEGGLVLKDEVIKDEIDNWLDDHPEATTTVQDGSITESKFSGELKLKTIKDYLTPEMFGAVGDGVTDDRAAIVAMIAAATNNALCVLPSNYYISDGIEIAKPINFIQYGIITVAPTADYCVRVSGHDARRCKFRFNLAVSSTAKSQWDGTYNTIGLDCYATWENEFDVNITGFNIGVRLISTNKDCDYNKIFIRYIYNCKTAILLTGDENTSGGTTSQNTFIGGRIGAQGTAYTWLDAQDTTDAYFPLRSVLVGNRTNNNNNFISCSFEGFGAQASPYENRAKVSANYNYGVFVGCRYEGVTYFHGTRFIAVISGFGFDDIDNVAGAFSVLGSKQSVITAYADEVQLVRRGDAGNYASVKDYNGNLIARFNSGRLLEVQGLSISGANKGLFNDSSRLKILATKANPGNLTEINNGEIMIGNPGYILHKNESGTSYTYMPIKTSKPSASSLRVTGMMVFVDGIPQWWNGTNWVDASGTVIS